jgi:dienelactone hydrolase
VLALGYYATEGLPGRLVNIPLEYVGTALQWLAEQPSVDSTRIGVVGQSRGAELALLIGAQYPIVRAVVGYVPSHVAWPGTLVDSTRAPAWSFGGRPVPGMYGHESDAAVARYAGCPQAPTCRAPLTRHQFLALLDDTAAVARAEIPVERINGPLFLVSGEEDGLWPSTPMAERIVARLRQHGFRYRVENVAYSGAGHAIGRPYVPIPDVAIPRPHPITGRLVTAGGTPAGTALASEDSWRRVLTFLDATFRVNR